MTRTRYRFGHDPYPYFMTDTIVAWLPIFSHPVRVDIILNSWRFLQEVRQIKILAWVILENHLHWIAAGPSLSRRVGEFKSFTARTILDLLQEQQAITLLQELAHYKLRHKSSQEYQLWQEGSHPKVLATSEILWQKVEYIHNNPLRRGYVDHPEEWRYSSARSYAGRQGLIEVEKVWR